MSIKEEEGENWTILGVFTRQTSKTLEQTGLGYLFILNFIQIQINFV